MVVQGPRDSLVDMYALLCSSLVIIGYQLYLRRSSSPACMLLAGCCLLPNSTCDYFQTHWLDAN